MPESHFSLCAVRTYPVIASAGNTQFRIFNGIPDCDYRLSTNLAARNNFTLNGLDFYYSGSIDTINGTYTLTYSIETLTEGCRQLEGGTQQLYEAKAHTLFLRPNQIIGKYWYEDDIQKSNKSLAHVRTLANLLATTKIVWTEVKTSNTALEIQARNHELYELSTVQYVVTVGEYQVAQVNLRPGGVYSLVIGSGQNGYVASMFEVTQPNSISMLWLVPQYVIMTLGEVMFSVTGLEFSYSEAPTSMKSVLQACWLLTVAFGNVIVVIVAELKFFQSQANEFFLFAGLMFVDMLIFMWVAYFYIPNNGQESSAHGRRHDEDKLD
ncbi:uncharacterized protein Dwil_GK10227 [Drosophila willistoni]|uniref:Peptide transporter family 1 n=1 Tax=Drosophila willistoni TaxID=7260 RepID=B4NDF4_DROWI|nr:peptide transporter family 1 [Drosophila willistoni]EDW82860.1 uncharacterized protein Dwil_GK10227 [Drosophila willistoni]